MSAPTGTAVSQLADRLRQTTPGQQWLAPITIDHARDLLALIADLCPAHNWCLHCHTYLCDTCELGEYADCTDDSIAAHCADCTHKCDACRAEIVRDTYYDERDDVARFGDL